MDSEDPVDWDKVELNIEVEPVSEDNLDYFPSSVFISTPDCTVASFNQDQERSILESSEKESSGSEINQENNSSLFCFLCENEFAAKENLVSHLQTLHKNDTSCLLCQSDFTSILVLLIHIDYAHTSKAWTCCLRSCSSMGKLSSESPFVYIRHRMLNHSAEIPGSKDVEATVQLQKKFLYVCHFCKTGIRMVENLFLHMVYIHRIDWDIAFAVAAKRGMLHRRPVWRCAKCPKTLDSPSDKHCQLECENFVKNYSLFTVFCRECHWKARRDNKELVHQYCVQAVCSSSQHYSRVEKGQRVPFNIVYSHGGHGIGCYTAVQKLFTCPQCFDGYVSFYDLSQHYFIEHDDAYEFPVSIEFCPRPRTSTWGKILTTVHVQEDRPLSENFH